MIKKFSYNKKNSDNYKNLSVKQRLENYKNMFKNKNLSTSETATLNRLAYEEFNRNVEILTSSKDMFIFKNKYKVNNNASNKTNSFSINEKIINKLKSRNFFDEVTGKINTGSELIKEVVDFNNELEILPTNNRNIVNVAQTKKALDNLENIYKHGGDIISYDIESIGGVNKYGHNQLDLITELSLSVYNYDPAKNNSATVFNEKYGINTLANEVYDKTTVFGLSNDEYVTLKKRLSNIKNSGKIETQLDKVTLSRLMVYGDNKTVYKETGGFEHLIVKGVSSTDLNNNNLEDSINQALKGLEKLREIGVKQEAFVKTQTPKISFDDYKKEYVKEVTDLIYTGKNKEFTTNNKWITSGYNILNFDNNVLNKTLGTAYNIEPGKFFDPYQALMYSEEVIGPNSMLSKKGTGTYAYGKGTLEHLSTMAKTNTDSAHIAKADQQAFYLTFLPNKDSNGTSTPLFEHFNKTFNKAYDKNKNKVSKGVKGKTFLTNRTMVDSYAQGEAFGFAYEPLSKEFKSLNGYVVKKEGVAKHSFGEFGPKSNMLVNHEVVKLDLKTDDWQEVFRNSDQDAKVYDDIKNAKELYMIKTTEYIDKDEAIKYNGKTNFNTNKKQWFTFVTDKEKISSFLGQEILDENGNISDVAKSINFFENESIGNEVKFIKKSFGDNEQENSELLNKLKSQSTKSRINDSALRQVREYDSKFLYKTSNFVNSNGSVNDYISELIAKNQNIDNNIPVIDLLKKDSKFISVFGSKINGATTLLPETAKKVSSYSTYVERNLDFFNFINQTLDKKLGSPIDTNTGEMIKDKGYWNKRDYALRQIFENLSSNFKENSLVIENYNKKSSTRVFSEKDLNKLDIKTSLLDINKSTRKILSSIDNNEYTTIDLNNVNSFIKNFFEAKYKGTTFNINNVEGFNAVLDAYDVFKKMNGFEGIFDDLSKEKFIKTYKNGNNLEAAGEILKRVKKRTEEKRKEDINFGYSYSRDNIDISSPEFIESITEIDEKTVKKIVSNSIDNLPKIETINNDSYGNLKTINNKQVDELVNKYFFNIEEGYESKLKKYSEHHQKLLKVQYDIAKDDSKQQAEELLKVIAKTNQDLVLVGEGKNAKLGLIGKDGFQFLDVPRYESKEGLINYKIGNNNYAVKLVLDHDKENSFINNNINQSHKKSNTERSLKFYLERDYSETEAIQATINYKNKVLRDAKTIVSDVKNYDQFSFSQRLDVNSVVNRLKFNHDKVLEKAINMYGDTGLLNEKDIAQFNELIKNITSKENLNKTLSFDDLLARDKNLLNIKFMEAAVEVAKDELNESDKNGEYILNHVGNKLKDTAIMKGNMSITNNHSDILARLDDEGRPPVDQKGGVVLYNRKNIESQIEKFKDNKYSKYIGQSINSTTAVSNNLKEQFVHNVDNELTGEISVKQMQVESNTLKKYFIDESDHNYKQYLEEYLPSSHIDDDTVSKLKRKVLNISTFEQQGNVNSRVADLIMSKTNIQRIKTRNELLANMANDINLNEFIKNINQTELEIAEDGTLKYKVGKFVKENELLFEFTDELKQQKKVVRANSTGLLVMRYVDEKGKDVTEQTINDILKEQKVDIKDMKAVDKALSSLNKEFRVIGINERYGPKLMLGPSEKVTANVLRAKTGEFDDVLKQKLEDIYENSIKNDSLTDAELENLRILKEGIQLEKTYREDALRPLLNKATDNDSDVVEEVINRINKEQHIISDFISSREPFKDVAIFSNVDTGKHKSVSFLVADLFENLRDRDLIDDKHLTALLGDKNKYTILKDGDKKRVLLNEDNFDGISISKEHFIKNGMNEKEAEDFYKLINEEMVEKVNIDGDQKLFGYKSKIGLSHTNDHLKATVRGDDSYYASLKENISHRKKEFNDNKEKFEKAWQHVDMDTLSNKDKDTYDKLKKAMNLEEASIKDLEDELSSWNKNKGVKFSGRMNTNLNKIAYTNNRLSLVRDDLIANMGEEKGIAQFNKIFSHALENPLTIDNQAIAIKEDFKGMSMLEKVTDNFRKGMIFTHGETRLSDVKRKDSNYFLKQYFGEDFATKDGMTLKDITVDRANLIYEANVGNKALTMNKSTGIKRENLRKELLDSNLNFKEIDLSQAKFDQEYLQFNDRELLNSTNNVFNDNYMIKTGLGGDYEYIALNRSSIKKFDGQATMSDSLNSLRVAQSHIKLSHDATLSKEEREKHEDLAKKYLDSFVDNQRKELNSKTGVMGELFSNRLEQSAFGRASGEVVNTLGGRDLESLRKYNPNLTNRYFQGKSLIDHYHEGKYIDYVLAGEETFDKLGYFKEDFLDTLFPKELSMEEKKEQVKVYLRQHGDSAIAGRFPEIMDGSDKPVRLYLDDDIRGDELKTPGHTAMSWKQDHDGDRIFIARAKTDKNQSNIHLELGVADNNAVSYMEDMDAAIMSRAVNENSHWNYKVEKKLEKEFNSSLNSSSLEKIAEQVLIDGKLNTGIDLGSNLDYETAIKHYKDNKDLIALSQEKGSHKEAIEYIKNSYNENEVEDRIRSYVIGTGFNDYKNQNTSKTFKSAVGEANVTAYKVKSLVTSYLDSNNENYDYDIANINELFYQAEEAAISAKSDTRFLDPQRTKIFNENIKTVIRNTGDVEQASKELMEYGHNYLKESVDYGMYWGTSHFRNWTKENLNVDNYKDFVKLIDEDEVSRDKVFNKIMGDTIDLSKRLGQNRDVSRAMDNMSIFMSSTGVNPKQDLIYSTVNFKNESSALAEIQEGIKDKSKTFFRKKESKKYIEDSYKDTASMVKTEIKESIENNINTKSTFNAIMEETGDLLKNISKSKLGLGAIGLASAVMLTGYVGGRPRPADTHAMEEAENTAYNNGEMILSDNEISQMQGNQGYVININAKTNKGREHAINAIQQAISSATQSNVNISMNINDNYGNVNDKDIANAIWESF